MDDLPDNIDLDDDVVALLGSLRDTDPALFAALLAAFTVISLWIPDRPLHPSIKRYEALCEAGYKVWRFKDKKTLGQWRIFFCALDALAPPRVLVPAVVKYESQDETYDNLSSPHAVRIKRIYLAYQAKGEIRR